MNPGIYPRLDFDEYKAIDAWSPSLVKAGLVSMLELDYRKNNPKPVTAQMRFGSAVHCAVLEPDEFVKRYVIWDGGRRAGKDYKQFCAVNEGKEVLTALEYEQCLAARDSAYRHPIAGPLLSAGKPDDREVSMVWRENQTGLWCKGRADRILEDPRALVELKTTRVKVVDDRALTRIASTLGYHISLAAYQDGYSNLTGHILPAKIIFVEQLPPHDVRVLSADTAAIEGWDQWQKLLEQIVECSVTGIWPGCDQAEGELKVWETGIEYADAKIGNESI